MKLFLLIFCLVCISITTAQECTRKNDTYTKIAKPLKTKTAKRCTAKCEKSSDCVSWTWNKKEKMCYLIKEFDLAERTPWISGNCGEEEGCMKISVTCGDGVRREFCFLCGDSFDSCQGTGDHPDCIFTSSDTCIPNYGECVPPFRPGPGSNGQPNSLCYYFSNTLVPTWEEAENRCQSMSGSYLAFIETQAQQDYIVKVLDAGTSDRTFIGGTSKNNTDLTFYWLFTSTAVDDGFTFWGPGEPNYKEEQCMELVNQTGFYPEPWMWNNINCERKYALHSYICVYDLI